MHKAVCCVPVSAVRADPSHKAEMVTQLLFGEGVDVRGQQEYWISIKCWFDGYEGWIPASHVIPVINEMDKNSSALISGDWVNEVMLEGQVMYIPFGCDISSFKHDDNFLTSPGFSYSGKIWKDNPKEESGKRVKSIAMTFINTAYLWGGKSVFGIDCSGFTQTVYRLLGIPLLRDAYQQATLGREVSFSESKTGDLGFFENEKGKITHVGILLNDHEIIHASGKVRIDYFDEVGITNSDTKQQTHSLTTIRRYF